MIEFSAIIRTLEFDLFQAETFVGNLHGIK